MRPLPSLLLALSLLAACGGPVPVRPTAQVRDSAGIRVVTSSQPGWPDGQGWMVRETPLADVGGVAGDSALDFMHLSAGVLLPGGGFVVADQGARELRWFDGTGRFVGAAGGRRAPSLLGGLAWVAPVGGDTVAAYDARGLRVVRFAGPGVVADSWQVAPPDTARGVIAFGSFADGALLGIPARLSEDRPPATGAFRPPLGLWRLPRGGVAESLGVAAGDELFQQVGDRFLTVLQLPLGRQTRFAVGRSLVASGEGTAHEVTIRAEDGRVRMLVRWPGSRRALAAADRERALRHLTGAMRAESQREQLRALWKLMPLPDSLPAHGELRYDRTGALWVEEPVPPGDRTSRWAVIAADGQWLGRVTLPPGSRLLDATADRVLVAWSDPDGVEHARVHALRR